MRRWQLVLALAVGVFILEPIVAERLNAQTTETELGALVDRISHVEAGLRDVERHVYGARTQAAEATGVTAANEGPASSTDQARDRLIERMDGLEYEVRSLTGQVEELGYKINQLQQQFEQFSGKSSGDAAGAAPSGGAGVPLSGNSAQGPGLAPGETTLGQIPADSVESEASPEEQYNTALGLLRGQDYKNAEAAFKSFIARNGETSLAGPAMYWLGETYFVQNDFTNAAQTFLNALKNYPDSPKAADSMLKLGMSLAALANLDADAAGKKVKWQQACASFRDLPKKYPNASQTILQRALVESGRAGCPSK